MSRNRGVGGREERGFTSLVKAKTVRNGIG